MGKTREVTAPDGWSAWRPLDGPGPLPSHVLAETLDGGQAFRWQREPDESWLGVWAENIVRLRLDARERLLWSAPAEIAGRVEPALRAYLDSGHDARSLADPLPWRSDPHLAGCIAAFPGLRILRQPLGETLLCFLCSATKQIVQIKQMVALLAARHGASIICRAGSPDPAATRSRGSPSSAGSGDPALHFNRLPTWAEIAEVPEAKLRECLLGFRARYISETARFLAAHPGWLEETERLPYAAAKERLCSLPGVGAKVADCVLLFGAGRLEAFPVDVWILKTLARRYGLEGWKPAQLAQFGRAHFGPRAGLAQQFLFAWERRESRVVARSV